MFQAANRLLASAYPMDHTTLLDALPPEQRLALTYARGEGRVVVLGMLALDARLAGILRGSREPMLAQLRLAWWREQLSAPIGQRPQGEPLLALLDHWGDERAALGGLVDGWEALLGDAPLPATLLAQFADGRAAACAALSRRLAPQANPQEAERAGRNWALVDLATRVSHPEERASGLLLANDQDWRRPRLARSLRPLLVLHGLAERGKGGAGMVSGPGAMLRAVRLGLLGI